MVDIHGSNHNKTFNPLLLNSSQANRLTKVAQQLVEEWCFTLQLPHKEIFLILCTSTM